MLLKRPAEAFGDDGRVDAQWKTLGYLGRPELDQAAAEHRRFVELLEVAGAEVELLPEDPRTGLDSIYTRDPVAAVTGRGVILGRMGKDARKGEPDAQEDWYLQAGIPVAGRIEAPGMLEGGDVSWLREDLMVAGLTYRTNREGIRQLRGLLKPLGINTVTVPMVHWDGPDSVLHLMSIISMLDEDLALVYERLLPIPFRELLVELGIRMIPIPDDEYASLGCNVLTVKPRNVLVRSGNSATTARMRAAGCTVEEFEGDHICYLGSGGPTCLTQPLLRV